MATDKKQPGFMYLDKNGFYFYESGLESVVSLAFLTTSVRDMDVVSGESIVNQISGLVAQYKLTPASIIIVLSPNITFEKDITGLAREETIREADKFLDTVPFESVLQKDYPIEKGVKIIAANDDLYRQIRNGFEKNLSSIQLVIPYQMLGQDQGLINNLNPDNAMQIARRADHYKQFNMLPIVKKDVTVAAPSTSSPTTESSSSQTLTEVPQKKVNVRLIAMIGVFGILFIILGIMIIRL